jgi:hypothetical protein
MRRQGFWHQWRQTKKSLAHLVGFIMRRVAVMQASRFERDLKFDPFSLLQNGIVAFEVDVGGA